MKRKSRFINRTLETQTTSELVLLLLVIELEIIGKKFKYKTVVKI